MLPDRQNRKHTHTQTGNTSRTNNYAHTCGYTQIKRPTDQQCHKQTCGKTRGLEGHTLIQTKKNKKISKSI